MEHITSLIASILAGLDNPRIDVVITADRAGLEGLPTAGGTRPSR